MVFQVLRFLLPESWSKIGGIYKFPPQADFTPDDQLLLLLCSCEAVKTHTFILGKIQTLTDCVSLIKNVIRLIK